MTSKRGKPFTDDHRVVLMMLRELKPKLTWAQVAEAFNIVFRNDRNEDPRTMRMLQQSMSHRNTDQNALWNTAYADLSRRNRWQPAIDAALRELRTPNRASITKESEPNLHWDHKRRLGLHLLMRDKSLNMQARTKIFNTIFQAFMAKQQVKYMSEAALSGQYDKEKRNAERATDAGPQEPPTKSRPYVLKRATAVEDWQRILQEPQTEMDLAKAAKLKKKISELQLSKMAGRDHGAEDGDEKEENEVEVEAHEHTPQGNQGEPSYNANENVGRWRFGTWDDWNQTRHNLGRQLTGMEDQPSAEDVRRLRMQIRRSRRNDAWTQGINIYPGPETVDWARVNPETQYRSQQGGQGESSLGRAYPKQSRDSVPATAMGESGGEVNSSEGEESAEEGHDEDGIQDNGPEDGPEAKKSSSDNVTPH